ncbi:MAG: cation:proton antiporter [Planctomycetes bacterium]|nr:cation:proton antiporter [Planctomycetota bacterium]
MNVATLPFAITGSELPAEEAAMLDEQAGETTAWEDNGAYQAGSEGLEAGNVEALEIPAVGLEDVRTGPALWHTDPADSVLLAIVIVVVAAKAGEEAARRLGCSQVVGELVMGIILGNIYLFSGLEFFNFVHKMPFLKILSEIGAIVLLLEVGIHTDLRAMLKVGLSVVLVTLGGILMPAGLGCLVVYLLLPDASLYVYLFLIAILCTSSVVMKPKMFYELGKLQTVEARITIAAAMINEVAALLFLAAISSIAITGQFSPAGTAATAAIAVAFLGALGAVSLFYGERFGDFVSRKFPEGIKIFIVVVVCIGLAYLSEAIGLATIVGAFSAGLFLRHIRVKSLLGKDRSMEELVRPAYLVLVPIFFVLVGAQVRLDSFMDVDAVLLGLSITGAAILGKLFCSVCVVERGVNRLAIGVAMIPRLEVALIIASVGYALGVLDEILFSAVIIMVAITALMSPPLLKLVLSRSRGPEAEPLKTSLLGDKSRSELLISRQLGRK